MRNRTIISVLLLAGVLVASFFAWAPAYAQGADSSDDALATATQEIDHLVAEVDAAVALYADGRQQQAVTRIQEAFFFWEASNADRRLRSTDLDLYGRLESNLLELRGMMRNDAPVSQVQNKADLVHNDIGAARSKIVASMSQTSALAGFFESFVLIVREGFEAILIVGAVLAYLNRTGHEERTTHVYQGALAGIGASVLTAVAMQWVFSIGIVGQELLEGITALLAVAVLFYVSHWLIGKVQHERWERFLHDKVQSALTTGSSWALSSVAFLAIYREGFETVLFYKALTGFYPGQFWALAAGFGLGLAVLAMIYGTFHLFQVRIPLRPFFLVTSLLLYYLAFSFAGKGMRALQEAGVIDVTPVAGAPTVSLMGIFPTVETLTAQAFLIALFAVGLVYTFLLAPRLQRQEQGTMA